MIRILPMKPKYVLQRTMKGGSDDEYVHEMKIGVCEIIKIDNVRDFMSYFGIVILLEVKI